MKKKLIFFLIFVLPFLMLVLAGCGSDESAAVSEEDPAVEETVVEGVEPEVDEELPFIIEGIDINDLPVSEERPSVEIYIEDHGMIVVELFPEHAPITVENFLNLVDDGFYDGLAFHRIIPGFMMQGGCPYGEGFGGSGENIVGEFSANGIPNPILHTRGVLSMARGSMDFNSASSQFFIMHQDEPFLDEDYAAFGRVIEGMNVVDSVVESVTPLDNNGTIDPNERPIIREARVVN